jgi:uracil-DNA glycosylase
LRPKPAACGGCPLEKLGQGFALTDGTGANGNLHVAEALGEDEAKAGLPLVGRAGSTYNRMLARARDPETNQLLVRSDFKQANIVNCRPPDNELAGAPWEEGAIAHCAPYLERTINEMKPKVILAMGNTPLRWFTGFEGIKSLRGYVFPTKWGPVIPTYHPSFIQRGNWDLVRVWQLDVLKALHVSRHGVPSFEKHYITRPSLTDVQIFHSQLQEALRHDPQTILSFDIETLYEKIDKDAGGGAEPTIEDDKSWTITRISFAFRPGHAISIPWMHPFIGVIQAILDTDCAKLVWNRRFDVPRVAKNGCPARGRIYDGMDAFHFLEPQLPMGLKYAGTFYCPDMPAWALMKHEEPAWYNAADSDVALRTFLRVREILSGQGRWAVFERHFVDLGLVLDAITLRGLNVDREKRREAREGFEARFEEEVRTLQPLVPPDLLPRKVFKISEERLKRSERGAAPRWEEGKMVRVTQMEKPPKPKKVKAPKVPKPRAPRSPSSKPRKKKSPVESVPPTSISLSISSSEQV